MNGNRFEAVTRRSALRAAGGIVGVGVVAGSASAQSASAQTTAQSDSGTFLTQGGDCVEIEPLTGEVPVEELYDYRLPPGYGGENGASDGDGRNFSSVGTRELQRPDTSLLFLYEGPDGRSLVIVHGSVVESRNGGGSASFTLSGLPEDGEWVVRDDLLLDPETGEEAPNHYDRWDVEDSPHRIDWTWGRHYTDGGAFNDLGEEFEVEIDPAFNEEAELFGERYVGRVTEWRILSGDPAGPGAYALDLSTAVTIGSGRCEG